MSVNSHSSTAPTARKRPVQTRSQRTVDGILDAAARIFTTDGYTATTTNHIADLAGVSIGSLYQYFPNKDALLVALEERHLDQNRIALRAAIAKWHADEPDADTWARDFVRLLSRINDSPLHVILYETAPSPPHLGGLVDALVVEVADAIAVHLRRWGAGRDAGLRARVIVVTASRLVHDLVIQAPPGTARTRVRREVTRLVAAYVVAD